MSDKIEMNEFSIKDLEHFSGIKAHTIRIWEQRYGLLSPERSDTNIRRYSDEQLKRLLNISLLYNSGFKISKIASMSESEVMKEVSTAATVESSEDHLLKILKVSMLNYDEHLFHNVVEMYLADHGAIELYKQLFLPFLIQVGMLWQTSSICPSQEHFVSNLIRQKLFSLIDDISSQEPSIDKTFVLYLPENEIHEISLILLHYLLKEKGYRSIYLGQSVPVEDLIKIQSKLTNAAFVSVFTVFPVTGNVEDYFNRVKHMFGDSHFEFHVTGYSLNGLSAGLPSGIEAYSDLQSLADSIL